MKPFPHHNHEARRIMWCSNNTIPSIPSWLFCSITSGLVNSKRRVLMCFSTPPQHSKLASFTRALCSFCLTLTHNSGFTISPQDRLKQPGMKAPMDWCIAAPNELQPNLKTLGHLFLEISCPQDFQKTCPKTSNPSKRLLVGAPPPIRPAGNGNTLPG